MLPVLYGVAAVLTLWAIFEIGDRVVRAWMLSRLRRTACPKCGSTIGTSLLRKCGHIIETFGEVPTRIPYGSETLIELQCNSCCKPSIITLRGEDGSIFEDGDMNCEVGLHAE